MPYYSINTNANTSELQLQVDGVTVATFVYVANNVDMGAFVGAVLSIDKISYNITQLEDWIVFVQKFLSPDVGDTRKYNTEYDYKLLGNHTYSCVYKLENIKLIDATYDFNTKLITVLVRPQINVSWYEFKHWVLTYKKYVEYLRELL